MKKQGNKAHKGILGPTGGIKKGKGEVSAKQSKKGKCFHCENWGTGRETVLNILFLLKNLLGLCPQTNEFMHKTL